jgi:hypothetical protein
LKIEMIGEDGKPATWAFSPQRTRSDEPKRVAWVLSAEATRSIAPGTYTIVLTSSTVKSNPVEVVIQPAASNPTDGQKIAQGMLSVHMLLWNNDVSAAVQAALKLATDHADNIDAFILLGDVQMLAKQYRNAQESYQGAMVLYRSARPASQVPLWLSRKRAMALEMQLDPEPIP